MEFFLLIDYYLVCLTVESFVPAAPALLHLFRCASFLPLFFFPLSFNYNNKALLTRSISYC
jgi:hypothetical protein